MNRSYRHSYFQQFSPKQYFGAILALLFGFVIFMTLRNEKIIFSLSKKDLSREEVLSGLESNFAIGRERAINEELTTTDPICRHRLFELAPKLVVDENADVRLTYILTMINIIPENDWESAIAIEVIKQGIRDPDDFVGSMVREDITMFVDQDAIRAFLPAMTTEPKHGFRALDILAQYDDPKGTLIFETIKTNHGKFDDETFNLGALSLKVQLLDRYYEIHKMSPPYPPFGRNECLDLYVQMIRDPKAAWHRTEIANSAGDVRGSQDRSRPFNAAILAILGTDPALSSKAISQFKANANPDEMALFSALSKEFEGYYSPQSVNP